MISIELSRSILVTAVVPGTVWIYRDTKRRAMNMADTWTVGLFVAFVLLSVLGGLAVSVFYPRN